MWILKQLTVISLTVLLAKQCREGVILNLLLDLQVCTQERQIMRHVSHIHVHELSIHSTTLRRGNPLPTLGLHPSWAPVSQYTSWLKH